jgi:hypothetical protein
MPLKVHGYHLPKTPGEKWQQIADAITQAIQHDPLQHYKTLLYLSIHSPSMLA